MINLKIADLRKHAAISQQQLADILGVAFQTVSKWETGVTMPDITLLPEIANFFQVSVDELLGLKPLPNERYIPSPAGTPDYWNGRLAYLKRSRGSFWNEDYLQFLIEKVWKLKEPVAVLDCGCGYGFLGSLLLPLLPKGSSYTGIDFSETLIDEGNLFLSDADFPVELICGDFLAYEPKRKFDFVICQAVLRHIDHPQDFLHQMVSHTKLGGLVVCMDVNRELESDGLYVKGFDYGELCQRQGFRKMWQKEFSEQGRDYAIGMKLPFLLEEAGLGNVEMRLNDRVSVLTPTNENYQQMRADFVVTKGLSVQTGDDSGTVAYYMNHGMDRREAEEQCAIRRKLAAYFEKQSDEVRYTHILGLMIGFGWKK